MARANVRKSPGGPQAKCTGAVCGTAEALQRITGHGRHTANAVKIRFEIFAGAHSGRLVELRASALVTDAKNAQAPIQPTSRESRLAEAYRAPRAPPRHGIGPPHSQPETPSSSGTM